MIMKRFTSIDAFDAIDAIDAKQSRPVLGIYVYLCDNSHKIVAKIHHKYDGYTLS